MADPQTEMRQRAGRAIRRQRERRRMSRKRLAELVARTESTIERWERGEKVIDIDDLHRLQQAIGLDPHKLIDLALGHNPMFPLRVKRKGQILGSYLRALGSATDFEVVEIYDGIKTLAG